MTCTTFIAGETAAPALDDEDDDVYTSSPLEYLFVWQTLQLNDLHFEQTDAHMDY